MHRGVPNGHAPVSFRLLLRLPNCPEVLDLVIFGQLGIAPQTVGILLAEGVIELEHTILVAHQNHIVAMEGKSAFAYIDDHRDSLFQIIRNGRLVKHNFLDFQAKGCRALLEQCPVGTAGLA